MDTKQEKDEQNIAPEVVSPVCAVSEEVPTETTQSAGAGSSSILPFYKDKRIVSATVVAILILVGAGYYTYAQRVNSQTVAIVNGHKISQTEYEDSVSLIEKNAVAQGIDLTQETIQKEVKNQALEILVNNALLISAANAAKIEVTDAEVQEKYDELATELGGEDALKSKMIEIGLTEEKLRSNIEERVLADKYIESKTSINALTVTDDEVAAFLDGIDAGENELPPLDEIKPQIEAQILSQKQQQVVADLISSLREDATIELKI
ncbi:MAG: SurA N-terminal domain-containing protein [Candidatus Pacebacteria bacterium]|nr:SurA N-terminal domain-containing protein [Candidatus Paceibacterota bacterium]MCF7857343.1 SurA N-terminal domain-containing protein [Candidatus Paceibacterota bacterium]